MTDLESLRAVLDAAPATLFLTDEAGEIVYCNEAAVGTLRDAVAMLGEGGLEQLRAVSLRSSGRGAPFRRRTITVQGEERQMVARLGIGCNSQADVVSSGAAEMTVSIEEISRNTSSAVSSTSNAVTSARAATESVERLSAYSAEIGAVSNLIISIAEQTNLLALNATIEAARAGEAGEGFAVVANEVKELASGTAEASANINRMIETIQAGSAAAAAAIADIVARISELEEQQTTIAAAVEEQSATAGASGGMARSARGTADSVGGVRAAAASLAERAARFRGLIAGL